MKRVEIRPQAEAEIAEAAEWYELQSPGRGVLFVEAVRKAFATIAMQPAAFSPVGRGARRYVLRQFPYAVIYRERGETIVIYSCFHGRRDPARWQERL